MSQPSDRIPPGKAKQILKDKEVRGHPLTSKQRGLFGAAAGRQDHDHPGGPESLKAEEGMPATGEGEPGLDPEGEHQHRQWDRYYAKKYPHAEAMHSGYASLFHHHDA